PDAQPSPVAARPGVTLGEDYLLPADMEPLPYTGYISHPTLTIAEGGSPQKNWWVSWADLEPERGHYDWGLMDQKLALAESQGYRISLHIQSITAGGGDPDLGIDVPNVVPAWVYEEFELTDADLADLGWQFDLKVIPGWRPEIRAAFEEFLHAFGEAGYPAHHALGSAYVHGISPSRGEEFWLEDVNVQLLESEHGFSPAVLQDWLSSRMDAYAAAFKDDAFKLAWVGNCGYWGNRGAEYGRVAQDLLDQAWALGMGNRTGSIERYNLWLNEPAYGQSVDQDGYLFTDESIAPLRDERFFGEENEEYGDDWTWRFGSTDGDAQRYRFAMLRALQMQLRFLATSSAAESINPELSEYARLSFGRTVFDSPDAWAYLRESPVSTLESGTGTVKNLERWLTQRDHPGAVTVPAQEVSRAFAAGSTDPWDRTSYYDFIARRTDLDNGQTAMAFHLDDRFLAGRAPQIKVEFLDQAAAEWQLEDTDVDGRTAATTAVLGQGDGRVKTATFLLEDARLSNGLDHGADFRLICDGPNDLVVRWVRVLRTPAAMPSRGEG
ncbi:beta-galactosidase, partial [bacterium]|nr:beta-galactosidase [bacterium]